jgi:hypothetical protein
VEGKKLVKTLATANETKKEDNMINDKLGLEASSNFLMSNFLIKASHTN